MEILHVDYSSPTAAQQFAESLHNTGFAVIKNHPISAERINQVYSDWKTFFASEDKNNYLYDKDNLNGFFPMNVSEIARGYDVKDIKEFYHFYEWGRHPEIGPATLQLFHDMSTLAQELLSWVEQETPEEIKSKFSMPLSDMIKDAPRTCLRILHYPPLTGEEQEGAIRAGEHSDINMITLLPAATDSGLQVKDTAGNWHDVQCDFGNISVNIGDMLEECTDHYYPSTKHRVINPTGEGSQRSRLSLPLFLQANDEVRLSQRYLAKEYWRERLVIGD